MYLTGEYVVKAENVFYNPDIISDEIKIYEDWICWFSYFDKF